MAYSIEILKEVTQEQSQSLNQDFVMEFKGKLYLVYDLDVDFFFDREGDIVYEYGDYTHNERECIDKFLNHDYIRVDNDLKEILQYDYMERILSERGY